mgnify:CR=1 FL=1
MSTLHPWRSTWPRALVALLWCALAAVPAHSSDSADTLVQAIRSARLEPERAVRVDSLDLALLLGRRLRGLAQDQAAVVQPAEIEISGTIDVR